MTLEDRVRDVKQLFGQKGIQVDSDWLNGCVEFFIGEDSSISSAQLYQQAEEQYELSDLCDSGVKCIPDTVFSKKDSHIINGTFPLQIQKLLDISESPYDQLQKLQNKETEVGKEQPEFKQNYQKTKKKRMLKLDLTDGFKTVSVLEYTQIPCLTTLLAPGVKVIVSGPLRCVNHILFLEPKNIRISGGEVTTLAVENAYENVLRKKLNQPINPNPKTDYQEVPVVAETTTTRTVNEIPSIPMSAKQVLQSNVISSATHLNSMDDFPDDDFLTEIDIDQIASKASNVQVPEHASTSHEVPPNRRSTLLFDDIDDNEFLNIDSTIEQNVQSVSNQPMESATRNDQPLDTSSDSSIFGEKYRFKIRGINLVTVKQLKECSPSDLERRKHFLVKAEVDDIIEKARVSHGNWILSVTIRDRFSGNVTLEATFHHNVTNKLAGKTGNEVNFMFKNQKEKPQNRDEIQNTLQHLTDRLEQLNTFFTLEFNANATRPIVVELIDAAPVLDRKLQDKIDFEKLL